MDKAVISEKLLELINDRTVLASVFTTYTFEPEFFELEVVPLILGDSNSYSADERVKRFMVRENLRESKLPIDVFYDLPMYRRSGDSSPEMEYSCHGVNLGNSAFHGKINLLLLEDVESEEKSLLVGAGSNNLSRAGWWDNIECQHWEEISNRNVSRKFLNILQEELEYLDGYCSIRTGNQESALLQIQEFVSSCHASNSAGVIHYFGLSSPQYRYTFIDFLTRKASPLREYSNWTLEIISPFFADDVNNTEYDIFFDMGVNEIKLFLPFDNEDNALCQDQYYQHIKSQDGISWATWSDAVSRDLELNGDYFRRLHAKIYHFYNKKQSWIFVGSVNFTYKAIHDNAEAGFLTKLKKPTVLLEPLSDGDVVDNFNPPNDVVPGQNEVDDLEDVYPEIHLQYDWKNKLLTGRTVRRESFDIEIINAEGNPVITNWHIKFKEEQYGGDLVALESLLSNGSLIKVRGCAHIKKEPFKEHLVMLQQVGWSHKPLNLPELTASQILAIYSGMSSERRQMMLIDAKVRALVLSSQAGELTCHDEDQIVDQFFSEYAEIFNAFAKFKERLENAYDAEQFNQVDYYLTGTGVDSLVTLLERSNQVDEINQGLSVVSRYLVLLSALEIYQLEKFSDRPNVKIESNNLVHAIKALKESDQLILEDNSKKNRQQFFKWYESEFFRVYTTVGGES